MRMDGSRPRSSFEKALGTVAPEERCDIEERAAILEFDAKLSRDRAERLALAQRIQTQLLSAISDSLVPGM